MSSTQVRPQVLSATTMIGDPVKNQSGEDLGKLEELMLDLDTGQIAYAVLSFGGFMGLGNKLFAIPWQALKIDTDRKCFVFDVPKETLEEAPGFDKDHWPETVDREWVADIYEFYGYPPYWE